jgi:opacity protein-like surface antigen
MKKMILVAFAAVLSASSALAQTTPKPTTDPQTPAVSTPGEKNPTAPVEGANSFTEGQAKSRIEGAGYSDVTGLKLDDKGIWQAGAKKDGKSVKVGLDYQGNVVAK